MVLASNVGNNPIFVWDDETHLTISTNSHYGAPSEPLEGAQSAFGVTISYRPGRTDDFKEALRLGQATSEYHLVASDVTARVYVDDFLLRSTSGTTWGNCEIAFEASHAGRFEKIGLLLQAWSNSKRKIPEPKEIKVGFAQFSIGKSTNRSYRKAALTYAFFVDFPLWQQQNWGRVIGDEQSIFEGMYLDEDRSMEEEWPNRLEPDSNFKSDRLSPSPAFA